MAAVLRSESWREHKQTAAQGKAGIRRVSQTCEMKHFVTNTHEKGWYAINLSKDERFDDDPPPKETHRETWQQAGLACPGTKPGNNPSSGRMLKGYVEKICAGHKSEQDARRAIQKSGEQAAFFYPQIIRTSPPSMGICAAVVLANKGPHNSAVSAATSALVISTCRRLRCLYCSTLRP